MGLAPKMSDRERDRRGKHRPRGTKSCWSLKGDVRFESRGIFSLHLIITSHKSSSWSLLHPCPVVQRRGSHSPSGFSKTPASYSALACELVDPHRKEGVVVRASCRRKAFFAGCSGWMARDIEWVDMSGRGSWCSSCVFVCPTLSTELH